MAERFERELGWCVGQLECMLRSSSNKDKDPRMKTFLSQLKEKFSFLRFLFSSFSFANIDKSESSYRTQTTDDAAIIR